MEQKRKKEKELMDTKNSMVIVEGKGVDGGARGHGVINGNGKIQ